MTFARYEPEQLIESTLQIDVVLSCAMDATRGREKFLPHVAPRPKSKSPSML